MRVRKRYLEETIEIAFTKDDLEAVLTQNPSEWVLDSIHLRDDLFERWEEIFPGETLDYRAPVPMRGDPRYKFRDVSFYRQHRSYTDTEDTLMDLYFRDPEWSQGDYLIRVVEAGED